MKDPTRWQEVLVKAGPAELTKQDIYDYYTNPKIQRHILNATGKNEVILRQSFTPEDKVLRRKDELGNLIFLRGKSDLQAWAERRMTEVHPTFGKKTDHLLVDLDPGEDVPWEKVQQTAKQVAQTLGADPRVTGVSAQFSGHHGFYIRGHLATDMNIDAAREKVKDLLAGLTQQDKTLTLGVKDNPQSQIRLDTTPLKYRGSVKAPYSLSAETGLVAAPVEVDDLTKVKPGDFTIGQIVKKAEQYNDLLEGIKTQALRAQMAKALQHYEGVKDPSHGLQHIREVVQGARDIMPESGVDPEQVLTAAILHDIAREAEDTSGVEHEVAGPEMARSYLGSFDPAAQKNILHAIRQHRTYGQPRTLLAKVVRDADKLYAKKPEILLRRLVEYRRAHGMLDEQIPEDARQRLVGHIDKEKGRLPSLLTPKAIEMAAPWRAQMAEIKNDPVKWNEAIQPYLKVKEAAAKLYRDRVEAFALTPDGKVVAGLYPAESRTKPNVAVPGGGIERGETTFNAARREFKEEAGIAIKNVRSLGVAPVLTAWSRKDKSYKGKDWQASIKKHPGGNRTHFVLADVDTAKPKKAPKDPTEFHKTLKARPIDDLIAIQRKAIQKHPDSDRLKQMRKRLEMLLKIKHTEKTAFDYEGLLRFADALDDRLWLHLWKQHQKERQSKETAIGAPSYSMTPESGPASYADPPPFAQEPRSMFRKESAKKEFAPGIPLSRKIHDVPKVKNKAWTLAVQRHFADRAGKHFDLRLVDPKTHKAHSFAIPKAELPKPGQMRLAIQQATHTEDYAMNFEGTIPKGTYGSGKVEMALKTPVDIIKANANHIAFKTEKGDSYTMFRMKDKNWGIKNTTK